MTEDFERRLTTAEVNYGHIMDGLEDVKQYLARSSDQKVVMTDKLATVIVNQEYMKEYQVTCNKERGDYGRRIGDIENFQSNQKKFVAGIAGAVGLLMAGGSKILEKVLS